MSDPAIWIDPARLGGTPCIYGTRLSVEHAAHCIAAEQSVDAYMDVYGVADRRAALCAAAYWVLTAKRGAKWERNLRASWREWAEQTWEAAWHTDAGAELMKRRGIPRPELTDPPIVDRDGLPTDTPAPPRREMNA